MKERARAGWIDGWIEGERCSKRKGIVEKENDTERSQREKERERERDRERERIVA